MAKRDYSGIIAEARRGAAAVKGDRDAAMRKAVALLWGAFGNKPISWVGFYIKDPEAEEMILVCREPKPACSPIALHGMCGRCYLKRRAFIVPDVRTLGADYVACDPEDQSELVLPLVDGEGRCDAVLDADSYDLSAFDENDAAGFGAVLRELGLTAWVDTAPVRL